VRFAPLVRRYPAFDPGLLRARAAPLAAAGLLHCGPEGLSLTPEGFLVSNHLIGRLLYG
jgi:oxygen-independent coproporphyrinogen-3 oxidase